MTPTTTVAAQQQQHPVATTTLSAAAPAGYLTEISSFVERMMAQSNAEREQLAARIEAKDAKIEVLVSQLTPPTISSEQLSALQVRLEGLHAAQLLSDDELHALEDLIADFIELRTSRELVSGRGYATMLKLAKLIGLGEGLPADCSFARQARRKYV
jgi:hypothetical protein